MKGIIMDRTEASKFLRGLATICNDVNNCNVELLLPRVSDFKAGLAMELREIRQQGELARKLSENINKIEQPSPRPHG